MLMGPNPVLARLGLKETDRVAILHVDDVGMCGASLAAFDELWGAREVTCGSVMVPCPWFRATAAWARANPQADLGVHATLTSEWPGYRWGPVSTREPSTGLMDGELCFPKTSAEVARSAKPEAAGAELRQQIAMAREAGIAATHLDTHMGSVMDAKLYGPFVAAALDAGLPPFGLRLRPEQWRKGGYDEATAAALADQVAELEAGGVPMLDRIFQLSLSIEDDRPGRTLSMVKRIEPGQIGYVVFHPAHDTEELRGICPDWRSRVGDFELLASGAVRRALAEDGVHLIGCRELHALMPQG
jgi:predicted glycoside hydrolase/deacetylase ChbG (UPF0249 family)